MFARRLNITYRTAAGDAPQPCPVKWIDNFAMRNFTNDPAFDDTLPVEDGVLQVGKRVPLDRLRTSLEDWFRRKGYLKAEDTLFVSEQRAAASDDGCRT
ncbi:MAG TPA: hypothetical protein VGC88_06075 [Terriglobales bacterium]|jgi:hypothetical protein